MNKLGSIQDSFVFATVFTFFSKVLSVFMVVVMLLSADMLIWANVVP